MNKEEFAEALKDFRKSKKMTQEQFALSIPCHRWIVEAIESLSQPVGVQHYLTVIGRYPELAKVLHDNPKPKAPETLEKRVARLEVLVQHLMSKLKIPETGDF